MASSTRDIGAADAGAARTAVGLHHVAIDVQRALAELFQVDHRAQAAPDQALDFLGAPGLLAARSLAVAAGMRWNAATCRIRR